MNDVIAVTDHNFDDLSIERNRLEAEGYDVVDLQANSEIDIVDGASECVALLNQYQPISSAVLDTLDSLEVIGRYGIGVDTIDIDSATENDIAVVNVPDYCLDEVAEHTIGLLLNWKRNISFYDRQTRAGGWDWKEGRSIHRITGSVIGIVGFGNISRNLATKLDGFDVDLLVYDPYVDSESVEAYGGQMVSFESLLAESDVISIHAPLVEETEGLFSENAFRQMQNHAIIINAARGPIVDIDALESAIETNTIAGACLDVLPEEPPEPDAPIREMDNVIVTPHVAWYSEESIEDLRRSLVENVLTVLDGQQIDAIVNPGQE